MRTPVVSVAVLALAAAALALPARAGVPSPPNCVVENAIIGGWNGVGISTGVQPCGPFHPELTIVIVRDAANLPVPGAVVKFVFGAGLHPHATQNPALTASCPAQTVAATADPNGLVQVSLRFAGYSDTPAVTVTANGVLLGTYPARSPDYNGDGSVNLADFSTFASDYVTPALAHPRSDFDNCPSTNLPDFGYFVAQYLASTGHPPAVLCP